MIALICFRSPDILELAEISKALEGTLGELATTAIDERKRLVALRLDDVDVDVAIAPQPVPDDVLEGPIEDAWYWPEASETLAAHECHLAVVIKSVGQRSALLRSFLLTRITAALGQRFGYLGVYWDAAGLVHSAAAFDESASVMSESQLPLRLWVKFQLIENDDGTRSLYTQGLEPLGFLEIEIRASRQASEKVNGWAFNIAHLMLKNGAVIEDGHTVGTSASEWIRCHHLPSAIDPASTVLFLDLDLDEELKRRE